MEKQDILSKGIYCIQNKINGKRYIGRTWRTFQVRWSEHKRALRKKIHENENLQKEYEKVGLKNFKFFILEVIFDTKLISEREQFWMDFYQCYDKDFGYNISKDSERGMSSEESIKKISGENNYGSKLNWEKRDEIVRLYNDTDYSLNEISKIFCVHKSSIKKIIDYRSWKDEDRIKPVRRSKNKISKIHKSKVCVGKRNYEKRDKVIELYNTRGLLIKEIAGIVGYTSETVHKILNEKNIYEKDRIQPKMMDEEEKRKLRRENRENLPACKLSWLLRDEIIRLYNTCEFTRIELSIKFNVKEAAIKRIISGKCWYDPDRIQPIKRTLKEIYEIRRKIKK